MQTEILGIDCAHYQEGIRWPDVLKEGVKFVINKATDGQTAIDQLYFDNKQKASYIGLITGAYCFNRFKANPIVQSSKFCDVGRNEKILALDIEWDNSSGGYAKYRNGGEMDDQAADHVFSCLQEIEKLSKRAPMIYTAPGFWTGKFKNSERFAKYPLWLNDFKAKTVAELRIPKPWKKATIWQFGEKPMAGVAGVDLNRFLGTMEELKSLAN